MEALLSNPYSTFIWVDLIASCILLAVIAQTLAERKTFKPGYSTVALIGGLIWASCQLGEYVSFDFNIKLVFFNLKYLGMAVVPPSWYFFCRQYEGLRPARRKTVFVILLIAIPLLFQVAVWSNPLHELMWKNLTISQADLNLIKTSNWMNNLYIVYVFSLLVVSLVRLVRSMSASRGIRRKQTQYLIMALCLPLFCYVADILMTLWLPMFSSTPASIAIGSIIILYSAGSRSQKNIPLAQQSYIEAMPDLVMVLNQNARIIYANPAAWKFFLEARPEAQKGRFWELMGFILKTVPQAQGTAQIPIGQQRFAASLFPSEDSRGLPLSQVLVLRDITALKVAEERLLAINDELETRVRERTGELQSMNLSLVSEIDERAKTEERLQTALQEKGVLLAELHHRVKNNLQIISSMLKLQARHFPDEAVRDALATAITRIRTIALIHEKLYKSEDFINTDVGEYFTSLLNNVLQSQANSPENITLDLQISSLSLDLDRSIVLGLIVNELLLNVFKHAFPDINLGKPVLAVRLALRDDTVRVEVEDNGKGMPRDFSLKESSTLGMKIISTLIAQLRGQLFCEQPAGGGSRFVIEFPAKKIEL